MAGHTRLCVLIAFAAFATTGRGADRPPNVVLIVADDMGYADAGCYGAKDVRTPHLDRLAREGTRYSNFCVAQAVCTASRAALLSGCYPNRIGLAGALNHTSTVGIHPDERLLPELFKAKGYATAHYGKWHLGTKPSFSPLKNGFDTWAGLPYSNDNGPLHPTVRGLPALPFLVDDAVVERDPDQSQFTARLTDLAVSFITANKSRPFFLYLPHVMPHVPIFASGAFRGKSGRGPYGDVIEELDSGVGKVLMAVRDLGLDRDTIVIVLSDNGPFLSYGDHAGRATPFREGKLTCFEGGVRVPFLVRWPGRVPAGRTADEFVTALDVLPTLATLCGLDRPPRTIDGIDLSPLWLGTPRARGRESFAYYAGSELHAVRAGRWKLHLAHPFLTVDGPPGRGGKPANVANAKPNAIEESGLRGIATRHGYRVESLPQTLYDLTADPGETTDVAAKHPGDVASLSKLADAFRTELGDSLTSVRGTGLRPAGRDDR
jgi:arylsulfatase A-like enzyme